MPRRRGLRGSVAELDPRLDDAELWRCVEVTVRDVLLPALRSDAEWASAAAVQLVGLARYAARRPGVEITAQHRAARLDALTELSDNPYVTAHWHGQTDDDAVDAAVADTLVAAVGHDDPAAVAVHLRLRALLIEQLDDELAVTAPLVRAFRGQLDA